MPRKKLVCANWKMNLTSNEAKKYFETFLSSCGPKILEQVDVKFAVPFTLLDVCRNASTNTPIEIIAQNVHEKLSGAFTGEISVPMLLDVSIHTSLVGHSERRQYFGETDERLADKCSLTQTHQNFSAMLCVGETLSQRESGQTNAVVCRQLELALAQVTSLKQLYIAYEPVWAIGTGKTATSSEAQEVHQVIRKFLGQRFSPLEQQSIRVVYGGSVTAQNAKELFSMPDIDGGLVGGASLKPTEFAAIVAAGATTMDSF